MIYFEINKQNHSAIEKWSEMTLEKGILFSDLCHFAPPALLSYYAILVGQGSVEEKEIAIKEWSEGITVDNIVKDFPTFYGKVICELSDVTEDVMKSVNYGSRTSMYKQFFETFVIGILHDAFDYEPKQIDSFIFKGRKYFLPITRNILGTNKPMEDRTSLEFTECADLQIASSNIARGKFEYAANIVAILCRPMIPINPNSLPELTPETNEIWRTTQRVILEPYDEAVCLERAKEFKEITMDIVFEVFFCLAQHIHTYKLHTVISLQEKTIEQM